MTTHRRHTLRSMTAMDAQIIRTHMQDVTKDPEYGTPTTRELAQVRRRQEWQGRRVRISPAAPAQRGHSGR
jgi:hypothetical protein